MVTIIGIIILAVLGYALLAEKRDKAKQEKKKQELLKRAEDRKAEKLRETIKDKSAQATKWPPVEIKTETYDGPVYASMEKEKARLAPSPMSHIQAIKPEKNSRIVQGASKKDGYSHAEGIVKNNKIVDCNQNGENKIIKRWYNNCIELNVPEYGILQGRCVERCMAGGDAWNCFGDHLSFMNAGGVLCNHLRKSLVVYVAYGTFMIRSFALAGCAEDLEVYLPVGIKDIDESTFAGIKNLKIHAPIDSYAAEYAKTHNIPCVEFTPEQMRDWPLTTTNTSTREIVLFEFWDDAIVLKNNKLYYRDQSNIYHPITAEEAYEKEIWYQGYQAEQDVDRGGMEEEMAFMNRGFFQNDKNEWEYGGHNRYDTELVYLMMV